MASSYAQETLKIVIGQVCQVIGFQGINSVPLDVLIDLLHRYLTQLATETHKYAEHCGRTVPVVEDLQLAFDDLGVTASALEEYASYVDPVSFPHPVPKLPVSKTSNLNFLKPGSQEILSRPIHIHEHLPPMNPENDDAAAGNNESMEDSDLDKSFGSPLSPSQQKKFGDHEHSSKKLRLSTEDEGQPVREIDSVMMTTSGFISSARAGKMPDARQPNIALPMVHSSSMSRSKDSLLKKKNTIDKINRHKTQGIQPGPLGQPRKKENRFKPRLPSAPPGTGSLKSGGKVTPKLKMPTPKPHVEAPIVASPKAPEKVKKDEQRHRDKRKDRKDGKRKDDPLRGVKKKEERRVKDQKKERIRMRMRGLSKEEELKRYKERETELIAALAASATVTVTSVPSPTLRVREKTPDSESSPRLKKSRENSPDLMIDVHNIKEEKIDAPPEEEPTFDDYAAFGAMSPIPLTPETPKPIAARTPLEQSPKKKSRPTKPRQKSRTSSHKRGTNKSPRRIKKIKLPPSLPPSFPVPRSPSPVEAPLATTPPRPVSPFPLPSLPNNPSFIPPFTKFNYPEFADEPPPSNSFASYGESPPPIPEDTYRVSSPPMFEHAPSSQGPSQPPSPPREYFSDSSSVKLEKRKEHKKDKKNRDKDLERDKTKPKKSKKDKDEKKKAKERLKLEKREKKKVKKDKEDVSSVPKLTLKFQTEENLSQASSFSGIPEVKSTPKLVIKPVVKHPEVSPPYTPLPPELPSEEEPGSPEIAKFAALITRPPKSSSHRKSPKRQIVPPLKIKDTSAKKSEKKRKLSILNSPEHAEKVVKVVKPVDTISASAIPESVVSTVKEGRKFSPSARPSAPKPNAGLLTETVGPIGHFVDDQGNEVWICPTCGKQDDGSPMIGCDTCDDWYHWLCVGIQVPPNENDNWYCPRCVAQRNQKGIDSFDKKKRGRKPKHIV